MRHTSLELTKLLSTLIGRVEPVGETITDDIRFENLELLISVTDWCLSQLQSAAKHRHDNEFSCKRAGERAKEVLLNYQAYIKEILAESTHIKTWFHKPSNN